MAIVTTATLPVTASSDLQLLPGSPVHDVIVQYNQMFKQQAALALAFTSDGVLKGTALSRGTTVTIASSQCVITIAGVPVSVAATTAQAIGAIGTTAADKWGIFAADAVAAGTISFVWATGSTAGFATEALAIAAAAAQLTKTADKARIGYVTILTGSGVAWVAGTDALAGGTGGNPATTTNYYNIASPWQLTADSANAITLGSIALTAKQVGTMQAAAILT